MAPRSCLSPVWPSLLLVFALLAGAAPPAAAIRFNDPEEDPSVFRTPTPLPQSEYYLAPSRVPVNCRWRSGGSLLSCWLNAHPEVGDRIRWRIEGVPGPKPLWNAWPDDLWQRFVTEFDKAMDWYTDCLVPAPGGGKKIGACTPLNRFQSPLPKGPQPENYFGVLVSESVARRIYLSHVANALALEMTKAVPWSITGFSSEALDQLLGFDKYVTFTPDSNPAYEGWYTTGHISPGNATTVVQFMRENDLLKPTQTATIGALIEWSHRLRHYFSTIPGEWPILEHFWPTSPPIPLWSMIDGTHYTGPAPGHADKQHWTSGCYGTAAFFEHILRAANLPVASVNTGACGHVTPHFMSIEKYLSHGDDPYDAIAFNEPLIPGTQFLISAYKFNTWFPANDPGWEVCSQNIGRRPAQLAIAYLSDALVNDFCLDGGGGKQDHATSRVYEALSPFYTLKILEAAQLWDNLEAKAEYNGVCD